jgi:predicted ATPase
MSKLIGICGSQGSGKSTILQALKDMEFTAIEGKVARSILQDWNTTLPEIYSNTQTVEKFQNEIIIRKQTEEQHYINHTDDIVFVERTYADLFSYALLNLGRVNAHNEWLDEYYIKCRDAQSVYSAIFILPSNKFSIYNDGVRSINAHYGQLIDNTLMYYLDNMSTCPVVPIISVNVEDRVETILNTVYSLNLT